MPEAGTQDLSIPATDGVRLRVRHRPGTRRPAFLLLHGLASNARQWDEVADLLAAEHFPTYAVDLRGHGDSDTPDAGYDTATAASDVAAVASALGLNGAVVAGHSWGGSVALQLAAERPALVGGLALVDGGWVDVAPMMVERRERWRAVVAQQRAGREGAGALEARAGLRAAHPQWSDAAIEASMADLREGPGGLLFPRLPDSHFLSILESVWDERPHRWYPLVTVPVMLLPAINHESVAGGKQTREWVEGAARALPDATVRWYVGAEHYLHSEHPKRISNDLLDLAREAGP
ncbi:alpha/beta hydrolase [Actinomadura sp. DC4]|uniref:alpha/beta fold hydrolase n=1 Tax=Actinomadura sp. DC4 TaxID=3055069 RepID=UPI0025AED5D2|nr:alpha/beta hydrolase [Actinomadura sp. DC4]MDN3355681.1 alpha/beta hydrolase [Actinomadura sp. DC4]